VLAKEALRSAKSGDYKKIEVGVFTMGSPPSEVGREGDEVAREGVVVASFYIKETEVTQSEWFQVMGVNPSQYDECGDECPVDTVSWYAGLEYMNLLSKRDGLSLCYELKGCSGEAARGRYQCESVLWERSCTGYRYPTDAEWEYAARGGDSRATYNGELVLSGARDSPTLDSIAVYGGNSEASYEGGMDCSDWAEKQHSGSRCGPQRVKQKRANAYGLYDMLGNAREWTWNTYNDYTSTRPPDAFYRNTNPRDNRVYRGCSWREQASYCRAAFRNGNAPDFTSSDLGLRPVRSSPVTTGEQGLAPRAR
jgi:formylglycine-generating enzyme required for sulfatase activity